MRMQKERKEKHKNKKVYSKLQVREVFESIQ